MSTCGDLSCVEEAGETCETCPLDCGECPICDMAPGCTGATAVPTETEPLEEFNNGSRTNYSCGVDLGVPVGETDCADPQLRFRIREVQIERGFFDLPRQLYCIVSAEDGTHSELMVTPLRRVEGNRMDNNLNYRLSEGLFWGQGDLYRSISNVTITFSCFLSSDAARTMAVLDEIAGRAGDAAEHADGYGWVFGATSVIGGLISSSLAGTPDTRIMDVQQTIDADALLELTNGRQWDITTEMGNLDLSGHRMRLTVESWGCADVREIFE